MTAASAVRHLLKRSPERWAGLLTTLRSACVRLLSMISGVAVAAITVRLLGPDRYGQYVLIVTAASLMPVLALGTSERVTQRLAAESDACADDGVGMLKAASTYSGLGGAAGAVLSIAGLGLLLSLERIDGPVLIAALLVLLTTALTTPLTLASPAMIARGAILRDTSYKLIQPLLFLALVSASLLARQAGSKQLLLMVCASYAISLVAMRAISIRELPLRGIAAAPLSRSDVAAMARSSLPFFILQIAAIAALQTDRFIVSALGSLEQLSSYDLLLRIFTAFYAVYFIIIQSVWKRVGGAWARKDAATLRSAIRDYMIGGVAFWAATTAGVGICGPWLIRMFSGGVVAAPSYLISALVGVFFLVRGVTDVLTLSLYAMHRERKAIPFIIAHGATNLLFAWAGGLWYGVSGMVTGQIISFVLSTLVPFMIIIRAQIGGGKLA